MLISNPLQKNACRNPIVALILGMISHITTRCINFNGDTMKNGLKQSSGCIDFSMAQCITIGPCINFSDDIVKHYLELTNSYIDLLNTIMQNNRVH
jgi:hypothetical protein